MKSLRKRTAAFTLIELLVVVAIIAVLIAILLPALGKAKSLAKKTAATAQLRNISTACDTYFQDFSAYPGVFPETAYTTGGMGFSSSQALVLALSRAFYLNKGPTGTGAPSVSQIPNMPNGLVPVFTSDDASITPIDYSVGTGRAYGPVMNPSAAELSSTSPVNVFVVTAQKTDELPVLVDSAYGADALPILYYRAAQKYDSSVQGKVGFMTTVSADSTSTFSAFYAASNDYVWTKPFKESQDPTLPHPSATFMNSGLSNLISTSSTFQANLEPLLFNLGPNGTHTARGAYVLISAGPDRVYGTADDIVVAGGS